MTSSTRPQRPKIDLTDDLLLEVFGFFEPFDLVLTCARVCKQWHELTCRDAYWEKACRKLWQGKSNVPSEPGQLFPRALYDPRVDFSAKELKSLLQSLGVNAAGMLEKIELKNALMHSNRRSLRLPMHVPLRGKWKASYAFSVMDSRRVFITDRELLAMKFRFFFKSEPFEFGSTAWFEINPITSEHTFRMEQWPMPDVEYLPWRRNARGDVVIHHFPAHACFRRSEDWSFGLENLHVIFFQCNVPTFNEPAIRKMLSDNIDLGMADHDDEDGED